MRLGEQGFPGFVVLCVLEGDLDGSGWEVDRARREREARACAKDDADDLEHELVFELDVLFIDRVKCISHDRDVDARCPESTYIDEVLFFVFSFFEDMSARIFFHRIFGDICFDIFDDLIELLGRGGVEDAEAAVHLHFVFAALVDLGVCEQ